MRCGCGEACGCAKGGVRRHDVGEGRITRELALTRVAVVSTVLLLAGTFAFAAFQVATHPTWLRAGEAAVMAVALGTLMYGSLVYFLTRRGYLLRRRRHLDSRPNELALFAGLAG